MARKPAHWILRIALGLGLPTLAATALAADMNPTLAKTPVAEVGRASVSDNDALSVGGSAEPAPITADDATESTVEGTGGVEVIRERFPNSAVKVERHVTQDAEGNYYNHGLWTAVGRKRSAGRQRRIPLRQTSRPLACAGTANRTPPC